MPNDVLVGFLCGLVLVATGFILATPQIPAAQSLFDRVTSIVKHDSSLWGCDRSTEPKICDFVLECIKMQEVARDEEATEVVLQYKSKVFMATATICNTQFVGVCDTWQPQDRDLLPGFTHGDAGWLCKFQLELALAMSKLISGANSELQEANRHFMEAEIKKQAASGLQAAIDQKRAAVEAEGFEFVLINDDGTAEDGKEL